MSEFRWNNLIDALYNVARGIADDPAGDVLQEEMASSSFYYKNTVFHYVSNTLMGVIRTIMP